MPERVGFSILLHCFGLKKGIDFAQFGLESGVVFEGTTGVFMYLSFQFHMNKKKSVIWEIRNGFKEIFLLAF